MAEPRSKVYQLPCCCIADTFSYIVRFVFSLSKPKRNKLQTPAVPMAAALIKCFRQAWDSYIFEISTLCNYKRIKIAINQFQLSFLWVSPTDVGEVVGGESTSGEREGED